VGPTLRPERTTTSTWRARHCKALAATWYARKKNISLEHVETQVERDDRDKRKGTYVLKVRLAFHRPLTDEQRTALYGRGRPLPHPQVDDDADVRIETAPL
jgi:putative redox protein